MYSIKRHIAIDWYRCNGVTVVPVMCKSFVNDVHHDLFVWHIYMLQQKILEVPYIATYDHWHYWTLKNYIPDIQVTVIFAWETHIAWLFPKGPALASGYVISVHITMLLAVPGRTKIYVHMWIWSQTILNAKLMTNNEIPCLDSFCDQLSKWTLKTPEWNFHQYIMILFSLSSIHLKV